MGFVFLSLVSFTLYCLGPISRCSVKRLRNLEILGWKFLFGDRQWMKILLFHSSRCPFSSWPSDGQLTQKGTSIDAVQKLRSCPVFKWQELEMVNRVSLTRNQVVKTCIGTQLLLADSWMVMGWIKEIDMLNWNWSISFLIEPVWNCLDIGLES